MKIEILCPFCEGKVFYIRSKSWSFRKGKTCTTYECKKCHCWCRIEYNHGLQGIITKSKKKLKLIARKVKK